MIRFLVETVLVTGKDHLMSLLLVFFVVLMCASVLFKLIIQLSIKVYV